MKNGYILNDRYVYRKSLGKGATGNVYYAYDKKLEKYWAIKACNTLSGNELDALKNVDYYAFPRIVDVCYQDNKCFLVMDYIDGISLSEYCKTHSITEKQVIRWGIKIATALSYLHNMTPSMIYMDCKPDNIIITPSGDIRIVDFGSIYLIDNSQNQISGTRFYAPEEIKNPQLVSSIGVSTDIYCLGMTLYKLVTGCNTEYRKSNGKLCVNMRNRKISFETCNVIQKCTALKPGDRYQSMDDVTAELKRILSSKRKTHTTLFQHLSNFLLLPLQITLVLFILLSASVFNQSNNYSFIFLSMMLFFLLIALSRQEKILTLETKSDLFKRVITTDSAKSQSD